MRTTKGRRTGFTLIELLIVIAIIGILASITFPVFARVRDNARRTVCTSNIKQIGLSLMQYLQDNDDYMPAWKLGAGSDTTYIPFMLNDYIKNGQIWKCSAMGDERNIFDGSPDDFQTSYGINTFNADTSFNVAAIIKPTETVAFSENWYNGNKDVGASGVYPEYAASPYPRHMLAVKDGKLDGQAVIGFVDGHVKALNIKEVLVTGTTEEGNDLSLVAGGEYLLWNKF
jgi:prepilin-type N-terminal cleavage/methylation domain-containing protein/prepilin-type processing-associated H-X9-DG protein